jgi:Animal haem peroxidase
MSDPFKTALFTAAGSIIDGWAWLSGEATALVVNQAVGYTRARPHPWSTKSDYTSWDSLTDRTYQARHLPAANTPVQPPEAEVQKLFQRPDGTTGRLSDKSTCLFPAFAQYLTDSFIRTMPSDRSRTTTNHEIDLCPLYGRTRAQTDQLRLKSRLSDEFGRLKSQVINGEEYPPFLYPNDGDVAKPEFDALDPPLFSPGPPSPAFPPPPQAQLNTLFAVGGDRVNASPFAGMINTLLLREHNRVARELARRNITWDDERVFQTARNIMIPIFINVVIEQYINHITPFPFAIKADPSVAWKANWNRPNWITAEFSLLYRWHSLMPDEIEWPDGPIPTAGFSLNNAPLLRVGLDAAFSAAAQQRAGALGAFNTTPSLWPVEVLAIGQARRNRIDTYNRYRVQFGMEPAKTFADISNDPAVRELLARLYDEPDNVEFYPGLFAEDRVTDSPLPGLLMRMVAVDAFSQALTNPLLSEHVFNEATFTPWGLDLIKHTSKLGDILARNVPMRGPTPIEMTQANWRYA